MIQNTPNPTKIPLTPPKKGLKYPKIQKSASKPPLNTQNLPQNTPRSHRNTLKSFQATPKSHRNTLKSLKTTPEHSKSHKTAPKSQKNTPKSQRTAPEKVLALLQTPHTPPLPQVSSAQIFIFLTQILLFPTSNYFFFPAQILCGSPNPFTHPKISLFHLNSPPQILFFFTSNHLCIPNLLYLPQITPSHPKSFPAHLKSPFPTQNLLF